MKNWEEAAMVAAVQILTNTVSRPDVDVLSEIDENLTILRDYGQDFNQFFESIAAAAIDGMRSDGDREDVLGLVVETICQKQHDYGHGNILWGGIKGLALRMHDKTARIRNLERRGVEAINESLHDSWLDIIGYSLVGIMLRDGSFELPLAADLARH